MVDILETKNERTLLIGGYVEDEEDFAYSMEELENLAKSCELNVVGQITQKLREISSRTYYGKGKIEEINQYVLANDIEVVVTNDDLSTSQLKNIQEEVNCRVMDRTGLILDIFARRAKTKEAMLQVEIAQLEYLLSRLSLLSGNFNERLGLRGPGETKFELDRRKLENRISLLEKELKEMVEDRKTQRKRRNKNEIPVVALVGYTNSGKSTLMNTILEYSKNQTEEKKVYVEDMLFATLETTTRQIILDDNKKFLLTDTVGFVSHLPHQLVKAFRSTLEEITEADLILHVIDISNKNYELQLKTTEQVLKEIGINDIPILHVYNKIDVNNIMTVGEGVFISAKDKTNIDILINKIREILFSDYRTVKMLIPYTQGSIYSYLKENAYIKSEEYTEKGIEIDVELSSILYEKFKHLLK